MKNQLLKLTVIFPISIVLLSCQTSSNDIQTSAHVISPANGWKSSGSVPKSYEMGIDKGAGQNGNNTGTIKSIEKNVIGFGTLMQSILPDNYLGKRLRMSGFLKTKNVSEYASFWLRIDPQLGFDNMKGGKNDRSVKGTTEWKKYEVVLDVPQNSKSISFGALLSGTGQIWFENITFEVVDNSVPTTGMEIKMEPKLTEPTNLNFNKKNERLQQLDAIDIYKSENWFSGGNKPNSFIIGIQNEAGQEGRNAATIKSKQEKIDGFETLMQDCLPDLFLGKKIKMTGFMKSKNVSDWAGFWVRVDEEFCQTPLSFDNMADRPIVGTTEWKKYEIIFDVPKNASNIAYGGLLSGTGQIWFENLSFEIIGEANTSAGIANSIPIKLSEPTNLDFAK